MEIQEISRNLDLDNNFLSCLEINFQFLVLVLIQDKTKTRFLEYLDLDKTLICTVNEQNIYLFYIFVINR